MTNRRLMNLDAWWTSANKFSPEFVGFFRWWRTKVVWLHGVINESSLIAQWLMRQTFVWCKIDYFYLWNSNFQGLKMDISVNKGNYLVFSFFSTAAPLAVGADTHWSCNFLGLWTESSVWSRLVALRPRLIWLFPELPGDFHLVILSASPLSFRDKHWWADHWWTLDDACLRKYDSHEDNMLSVGLPRSGCPSRCAINDRSTLREHILDWTRMLVWEGFHGNPTEVH